MNFNTENEYLFQRIFKWAAVPQTLVLSFYADEYQINIGLYMSAA